LTGSTRSCCPAAAHSDWHRATASSRGSREKDRGIARARVRYRSFPAPFFTICRSAAAPEITPGADCGYKAAAAAKAGGVEEGNVGAGAGATIGKMMGGGRAMKGGLGSSALVMSDGLNRLVRSWP
jgi:L-aminopeptidase/D-esterase-like protein